MQIVFNGFIQVDLPNDIVLVDSSAQPDIVISLDEHTDITVLSNDLRHQDMHSDDNNEPIWLDLLYFFSQFLLQEVILPNFNCLSGNQLLKCLLKCSPIGVFWMVDGCH